MNKTNLTARRSALARRFAAFRNAAAASALSVTAEAAPAPRAPSVPSVWVAKRTPTAPLDPLDVPLDADFTPAPFEPYVSDMPTLDAAELAKIERTSARAIALTFARMEREIATEHAERFSRWAVRFVSDLDAGEVDYAPGVTEQPARVAPMTEADELLALILSQAKARRHARA